MNRNKIMGAALISSLCGSLACGYVATAQATTIDHNENVNRSDQIEARVDKMMERFDVNKDGVIDQEDRQKRKEARFLKIDSNGDGVLSRDELASARKAQREKRKIKMKERREQAFASRDKDGDGVLSREEFDAPRDKRNVGEGNRANSRGHKHGRKHGKRGQRLLKKADLNSDGKITRAELQTALETRQRRRHSGR